MLDDTQWGVQLGAFFLFDPVFQGMPCCSSFFLPQTAARLIGLLAGNLLQQSGPLESFPLY